jgi:16S rRNA C967 or C1407 C5-methylase (RsmB/RsmF family)
MLDVPCTGTGVMRRNPDLRWKFNLERVKELSKIQELILEESLHLSNQKPARLYIARAQYYLKRT